MKYTYSNITFYFTLFILWNFGILNAQMNNLKFERHDVKQGLSSSEIGNMIQDSDGYIWIATGNGLNRYDGFEFQNYLYDSSDSCSISKGEIFGITEKGDYIWMGSTLGILNKYNKITGCFSRYKIYNNDKLWNHSIWDIVADGDSVLWLATERGLVKFDIENEKSTVFETNQGKVDRISIQQNVMYNIHQDINNPNKLFIGTRAGVLIFDKYTFRFSRFETLPFQKVITDIYQEGKNLIWFSVEDYGIVKINRKSKNLSIYNPTNKNPATNFIRKKSKDEYWVGFFDYGLAIFNDKNQEFTFLRDIPTELLNFPVNNCRFYLKTKDDAYCFGTKDGLYISKKRSRLFRHYIFDKHKTKRPVFYFNKDVIEYGDNAYLVSNTYQLPVIVDKKTGKIIDTLSFSKNIHPEFKKLIKDNKNRIWITSDQGFYKIDTIKNEIKTPKIKTNIDISKYSVSDVVNSEHNALFFISNGNSLWKLDTGKDSLISFDDFFKKTGIINIVDLDFINQNELLIVAYPVSLKYFITQNKFEKIGGDKKANILKHEWINCGIANGNDILFGYGRKGINIWNEKTNSILILNKESGLGSNVIYQFEKDKNGNIWVETNNGLKVLSPENYKLINRFDQEDGLIRNDLGRYWGSTFKLLPSGNMLIGGHGFFTIINPDSLLKTRLESDKIEFESLLINGKEKRFDKTLNRKTHISIPYKENSFKIKFANLDFDKKSRQNYKYRLLGYEDNWFVTTNNNITFNKIPPGNYNLQLKLNSSDSVKSLEITIIPEWWQTIWFKIFVILSILGLIYSLYQKRIAYIREKESIKTKFNKKLLESEAQLLQSQMNSHFLFNTLNSIKNYIVKNKTRLAVSYLNNFAILIRKVLNNSEHKFISLEEELETIKLYLSLESLRFEDRFVYNFDVDEGIDPENTQVPPLLLQPFVENAVWHGLLQKEGKGKILISVKKNDNKIQYIITDNGIGRKMAKSIKSKSALNKKKFGLKLSEKRLESLKKIYGLNISFEIIDLYDDDIAKGTKVVVGFEIK